MEGNRIDSLTFERTLTTSSSLVENYPGFEAILRESLRHLVGKDVEGRVEIGMAKDGSGVGGEIFFSFPFNCIHVLTLVSSSQPHSAHYRLSSRSHKS